MLRWRIHDLDVCLGHVYVPASQVFHTSQAGGTEAAAVDTGSDNGSDSSVGGKSSCSEQSSGSSSGGEQENEDETDDDDDKAVQEVRDALARARARAPKVYNIAKNADHILRLSLPKQGWCAIGEALVLTLDFSLSAGCSQNNSSSQQLTTAQPPQHNHRGGADSAAVTMSHQSESAGGGWLGAAWAAFLGGGGSASYNGGQSTHANGSGSGSGGGRHGLRCVHVALSLRSEEFLHQRVSKSPGACLLCYDACRISRSFQTMYG